MTSNEARKHHCKPGYWLVNVAPLGDRPDWREQVAPIADRGLIFGHTWSAIATKQSRS